MASKQSTADAALREPIGGRFRAPLRKPVVGGSDSHTLAGWRAPLPKCLAPRNATEFLAGLRRGQSVAHGVSGDYFKLTSAVWDIGASLVRDRAADGTLRGALRAGARHHSG